MVEAALIKSQWVFVDDGWDSQYDPAAEHTWCWVELENGDSVTIDTDGAVNFYPAGSQTWILKRLNAGICDGWVPV